MIRTNSTHFQLKGSLGMMATSESRLPGDAATSGCGVTTNKRRKQLGLVTKPRYVLSNKCLVPKIRLSKAMIRGFA